MTSLLSARSPLVLGGCIFVLSLMVYANALENGYAVDDVFIIQENATVHGLSEIRQLLFGAYWPGSTELYRPLSLVTFAIEWEIVGDNPSIMHATNVVLHGLVSLLVFSLLITLGASSVAAFWGAAIFAVHPVHVEAVSNLVGRAELLAALFFLLACRIHLAQAVGRPARITLVAICYLFALAAKEIAVTLPAVLLALGMFREPVSGDRLSQLRTRIAEVLALVVPLTVYLLLRWNAVGEALGTAPAPYLVDLSTGDRLATASRLVPEYMRLLLWPQVLSSEWGPGVIMPGRWSDATAIVGALLAAALLVVAVAARRKERWVSLSLVWFALVIAPVSQVFFPIGVMLAERLLYLPSVAVAIAIPAIVTHLVRKPVRTRVLALSAATALCIVAGARTWSRTPVWYSSETVRDALLLEHPQSYRVLWQAADTYALAGRPKEALELFARAAALTHGNHHNLNLQYATLLMEQGDRMRAERLLTQTIARYPRHARAYGLLASIQIDKGEYDAALGTIAIGTANARLVAGSVREFAHRSALALDGLEKLDSALAHRLTSIVSEGGRSRYEHWLHLARLHALRGESELADAALKESRAVAADSVRDRLTLEPLPSLHSRDVKGWWDASTR